MDRHRAFPFGPSPREFSAAFRVGGSKEKIHPVDASGVMLASIQAVHQLILEEETDIQALEKDLRAARSALAELRRAAARRR